MRRGLVGLGVGIAIFAMAGQMALAAESLGLTTGGDKGTYYQFGSNLQALVKPQGIDLTVYPSRGSVENVYAVFQRPGVQMGIVQADVLAFVSRIQTDPVLKRIAGKTKMVFPLYNEEIHLLGRRDIASFDDLADRRVAIGREGSGTYLTSRLLFKASEVVPKEMVPIDTDEALAELKAGRIDAMFYVAGYPVKLLTEKVTAEDGLALIPITNKSIAEFYPVVEIPTGTYTWQATPVIDGGGQGRPHLVRLSATGLRRGRPVRAGDVRRPRVAQEERPSEMEGRRPEFPPEGVGSVRLRREVRSQGGAARDGDQAVVAQSGARRHQGHARQLSRRTSRSAEWTR